MIFLSDFKLLSVAKINIFFINNRDFTERYFIDKVHAILSDWRGPVQTTPCVTAPVSVDSQV